MTRKPGLNPPSVEVPYRVQTPDGPTVITFVAGSVHMRLADARGSRLILRSTCQGRPDVYAVFERADGPAAPWRQVTDELSLAELDTWPTHRRADRGKFTYAFEHWLDHVVNDLCGPRPDGPTDVGT